MTSLHVLVGTTKGVFILDAATWSVRGPFCDGWPINHVIGDRASGTIWAGGGGAWSGAGVWRSADLGATWTLAKLTSGEMGDASASADARPAAGANETAQSDVPAASALIVVDAPTERRAARDEKSRDEKNSDEKNTDEAGSNGDTGSAGDAA